ncbi:PDZ and LIM domain protein 1-like [Phyllostomus discolor]|uniref:PDZ and LIM domain protein 1-like n=1 Tax=Phyllostomus discolor TaxID=89673 RepID=A0A7E6DBS4_9CHIR|nr:PDZ and LIM domain protein 1-like [Phyllostomus discolor]
MNSASEPQEVRHTGSSHRERTMSFTASPASSCAPNIITNQHKKAFRLYSSEDISNFNSTLESRSVASGPATNGRALDHSQSPSGLVIHKESKVYKMFQEKQELNEPPIQSTSFLVLQEILESEEKGNPNKSLRFRSVMAAKRLHWLQMSRNCPHVINVTPALSVCLCSCKTVTATLSVMCALTVAQT